MTLPPRARAIALFLFIPVVVAFGAVAPGTFRQRVLDVLVALALCSAAGGAMALIDGVDRKRSVRDIIASVVLITFGLAAAFSMLQELASQFLPAMWLLAVLGAVVVIGVRLIDVRTAPVRVDWTDEPDKEWS